MFNKFSRGFTIVELVVVIVVLGVLTSIVFVALDNLYTSNVTTITRTVQTTDTRTALRSIENDIAASNAFVTSTPTPPIPFGQNNDTSPWSYKGNDPSSPTNRVLITSHYATDLPGSNPNRSLIYTGGCDPATSPVLKYYSIYFVAKTPDGASSNLYRRTIFENTAPCSAPFQKQTCAQSVISAYSSACSATDAVLLTHVSNLSVDYYASSTDDTPIMNQYPSSGDTDLSIVKDIKITIISNYSINAVDTPYASELRISLIN